MDRNEYRTCWYAIQVRSRLEFSIASILLSKGLEPFVPEYESVRQWSDRKVKLKLPLFPGYLFCRFDIAVLLPVIITSGVIRIVGSGKTPTAVAHDEIEAVRRVMQSTCEVEPHPFVSIGDKVRIARGPLAGLQGIVRDHRNRRLILSISLIQQSISVQVEDVY